LRGAGRDPRRSGGWPPRGRAGRWRRGRGRGSWGAPSVTGVARLGDAGVGLGQPAPGEDVQKTPDGHGDDVAGLRVVDVPTRLLEADAVGLAHFEELHDALAVGVPPIVASGAQRGHDGPQALRDLLAGAVLGGALERFGDAQT